jgi:hypothetical protein
MRFGHLRGVMLAVALISSMTAVRSANADAFGHVMPKEILARDLTTGEPYYAPPIPWGCYAKDGHFDHFFPKHCGICGLLTGKGAGHCGGHGLLGHGEKGCGKKGCGHCGKGLSHGSSGCDDPGCGLFSGMGHGRRIKNCGLCSGKGCGLCTSTGVGAPIHAYASEQAAPGKVVVTPQSHTPSPSSQSCLEPGCKLGKGHHHGDPSMMGDPCGNCKGKGCGLCGGLGRLFHHGNGDPGKCSNCGGKGCGLCSGLKSKLFGLLHPHAGDIKYFVGPGGPVPLTPGYVPYVVPTRSPRDFLAFPPYTPDGF